MLTDFVRLIFPYNCPGCSEPLRSQEREVCWQCLSDIEQAGFHHSPKENELYYRFAGKVPIEAAASLFFFDKKGKMQRIIKALKYKFRPQIGVFLGQYFGYQLSKTSFPDHWDILIPVPLHSRRLAERSYNQAEQIALGIASATGMQVYNDLLIRNRKTATQTRKSKDARWQNVAQSFVKKEMKGLETLSVLLVDDVITTGATLEACIKALFGEGPNPLKVGVLSLAAARHG